MPVRRGVLLIAALTSVAAIGVTPSVGAAASPARAVPRPSGCNRDAVPRLEVSHQLPTRALRGFVRTYCDDFNGRGHGIGHGWGLFSGQPGGDPGGMFAPSHVLLRGGLLTINTYRDPRFGGRWVTGGLCLCGRSQTYGAFFVRSRVTGAGDDNDELLWPAERIWPPEIDFNETGAATSRTGSYVHFDARNHQIAHLLAINLKRWHTWGVIWTPRSVVFTVDGRVWARVTDPSAIPHVAMTLDVQEQTFCFDGMACPTRPVSLEVDWATAFAPLP